MCLLAIKIFLEVLQMRLIEYSNNVAGAIFLYKEGRDQ